MLPTVKAVADERILHIRVNVVRSVLIKIPQIVEGREQLLEP